MIYELQLFTKITLDSKVHGANMGPIWGRQDPGGPQVGPMNFAIWDVNSSRIAQFTEPTQWHSVTRSVITFRYL